MICAALMVIITRKIREVHFALMMTVFGIIGVAQALILAQGLVKIPTSLVAPESGLVAGVALFSALGQLGVILAVKYEQAGPVSLLRSNDVIFSFILQFFFLNVIPDEYS
jgi:drug/metabolite transporter (DMT)-like permease